MDLVETNIVKPSDERPARRDGTCFYCGEKIGTLHKSDCVIVSRSIVLRMTIDIVVDVPRSWERDNIEFKYNDGTWCSDNILDDLGEWAEKNDNNHCACRATSFEFLREASLEDHHELPLILRLE